MRMSVLIIEDDAAIRRGLEDNFSDAGYSVLSATDGEQGLALAVERTPDLIVLDIMLPEMNGYHVCREVRRRKLESRIIMLTAKGQEQDIVRGLEIGADDYMTKPFSIAELLARATVVTKRHVTTESNSIRFGPFCLDLAARTLTHQDVVVTLTSKESDVLAYMLKHPGQVRTRHQILDAVWGNAILVGSRSVDRCMTTLRKKMEPDPRQPIYLLTLRDVGYRLVFEDIGVRGR